MSDLQQAHQWCAQARQYLKSAKAMKGSKALVMKAVDLYEQVLEAHGQELSEPYFGLGYIALAGGRPDLAVRFLQNGLRLSPDHARMRHLLGRARQAAEKFAARQEALAVSEAAEAAKPAETPAGPPPNELVSDLGPEQNADKVSSGPEVEMLQRALQKFGHALTVTGVYDRPTYAAVRSLQSLHKIPVTGLVDAATRTQINPMVKVVLSEQDSQEKLKEILMDFAQARGQSVSLFAQEMLLELLELLLQVVQDFPSESEEALPGPQAPELWPREYLSSRLGNMGQMGIVSKGLEVQRVQQILQQLGYPVKINGQFDLQTFSELNRFQLDQGLTVTGIVEGPTRERLNALLEGIFQEEATQEALYEEVVRFQTELQLQHWPTIEKRRALLSEVIIILIKEGRLPELDPDIASYFQLQSELGPANRPGKVSQGREVRLLQQVLRKLNFEKVSINGTYDSETYNAVRAFQMSKKLPMTGLVDARSREELNALILMVLGRREPDAH